MDIVKHQSLLSYVSFYLRNLYLTENHGYVQSYIISQTMCTFQT